MYQQPQLSPFEQAVASAGKPGLLGFSFFLCWLAVADGEVSAAERELVDGVIEATGCRAHLPLILNLAANWDESAVQLSSELLRDLTPQEGREQALEFAISVATSDGTLSFAENQILRLMADLLGLGRSGLNRAWSTVIGGEMPEPTDPTRRERSRTERGGSRRQREGSGATGPVGMSRELALAVLGLRPGAPSEEIRSAFRRLAQVHHPDRFLNLGPEAVSAAGVIFRRINEAYEFLREND